MESFEHCLTCSWLAIRIEDQKANRSTVASLLNRVAAFHGYKDWVEAYHEFNYTYGGS